MKKANYKLYTFVFALALPFVGGCKAPDINIGTKEVSYWGLFEPEAVMSPLISDFTKTNSGTKITYEEQRFDDLASYKETLLTRLKEGTGPCVARIHQSWVKDFSAELAPVPSSFNYEETFYPSAQESAKVGGSYFAVPLMYDGLALFYNPSMFTAAGIDKAPVTWDEFRADAVKMTKKDEKTGVISEAGAAIGTGANISHASDILGLMWAQTGVSVPEDLNNQAAYDALTFYTDFVKKDKVWDAALPESVRAFAEGKVAMIFAPSWRIFDIKGVNPSFEFKVAPAPQVPQLGDEEVSNVHWSSFWMEAVSKDCKAQSQAFSFLSYLTSADGQRRFFDEAAKARIFGEPYSRVDLADSLKDDAVLGAIVAGAPYSSSGIIADQAGNTKEVEAVVTAIEGNLKGDSEKEVLDTLQKTLQASK
jgi:multiple sugar transport system substrate-binding protein